MRERAFLTALFVAAAAASGGGLLALDHFGVLSLGPEDPISLAADSEESSFAPGERNVASVVALKGPLLSSAEAAPAPLENSVYSDSLIIAPVPRPARRFAYVAEGALPLSVLDALETREDGSIIPVGLQELESPDFWASETRQEVAAVEKVPPIVALPRAQQRQSPIATDQKQLDARLAELSPAAGRRLREKFAESKVAWPPEEVSLVAIKSEKVLELHARSAGQDWKFVHSYPVLAASGASGPKLRKGDKQVPEGVYSISFLNPNSRYHVSLRVNYPNKFDREMAKQDGRDELGGDIMIHGKNVSAGCLAVGDEAAEELFVLAARIGLPNIKVIIAPTDFRKEAPQVAEGQPKWLPTLYLEVASAMTPFKRPSSGLLSFFGN